MLLKNFRPQSRLVTKATHIDRPRFPVVDAHNHLADPFGGGWDRKPIAGLLDRLDEAGVTHYVDLDGGWGEEILESHLDYFKNAAPDRFQIFGEAALEYSLHRFFRRILKTSARPIVLDRAPASIALTMPMSSTASARASRTRSRRSSRTSTMAALSSSFNLFSSAVNGMSHSVPAF
jgi:hypothetical protein